jgi:hypothetical protein
LAREGSVVAPEGSATEAVLVVVAVGSGAVAWGVVAMEAGLGVAKAA